MNAAGTASTTAAKNMLGVQALCLKRALLFVKAYGELLAKFDLQSNGLLNLFTASRALYENPEFSKLILFCSKYENFSAREFWDYKFTLQEDGRIEQYELIDHRYIHVLASDVKKKGFSLFKKAEEINYPCARLYPSQDEYFDGLAIAAFSELSKIFADISEQIFSRFGAIGQELVFYDVALRYIHALSEKNVPLCYPTFSKDNRADVHMLYDLYLLMAKPHPTDVIPNVFSFDSSGGLLVFGSNGSGKTVYLRSIGTMQILAQAGLPIPCQSAEIPLFSQLAAQFSESEKEFCEGNDAGRFEQEVRELAAMVDTLKEGALVFLNETFQSTAYTEGAEGLYHLLNYFSACNIRWILVSHLRQLEEMFCDNASTVLHTAEGYKIS